MTLDAEVTRRESFSNYGNPSRKGSMKVLFISPVGASGPMMALLARCAYEVTCVAKPSEALDMIDAEYFSAVLIAEEIEDSDGLDFISKCTASSRNYWYYS